MNKGTLYGVSVGPGDPDLLTLKAVRVICGADVVALPDSGKGPGTAYHVAERYLVGKELLPCPTPMTRDQAQLDAARTQSAAALCEQLAMGKTVAYLCLGDIGLYSSYFYLHRMVRDAGYDARIVAGVSSLGAVSARLEQPLCMGSETLVVAPLEDVDLDATLGLPGTKVFMKPGASLPHLYEQLDKRGLLDRTHVVSNCGLPGEQTHELADCVDRIDYLSVIVVRDPFA